MEIDAERVLGDAIRDGLREAVKQRLGNHYGAGPVDKLIEGAIAQNSESIRSLLSEAMASCLGDAQFRDEIATAVRGTLAKTLVQRFGGELEKQVNVLKSDPTTRARITVAIEEIVKSKVA